MRGKGDHLLNFGRRRNSTASYSSAVTIEQQLVLQMTLVGRNAILLGHRSGTWANFGHYLPNRIRELG